MIPAMVPVLDIRMNISKKEGITVVKNIIMKERVVNTTILEDIKERVVTTVLEDILHKHT